MHAFGTNLHAATTVDGRDRKQLERLCRYLLRPPFSAGAIECLPDGRVCLDIARQGRSVTMTPEQFIAKLIALVVGPSARASHGPVRRRIFEPPSFEKSNRTRLPSIPAVREPSQMDLWTVTGMPATAQELGPPTASRIAWAKLLGRVFQIDVLRCPRPGCDGKLRPTAAVLSREEIALLLHGARGPPAAPVPGQLSFFN